MSARSFSPIIVALTVPVMVFGPLLACNSSKKATPDGHIIGVFDSPPGGGSDAPSSACAATASYGAAAIGSGQFADAFGVAGGSGSASHALFYGGALNQDPLFDALDIELYAGFGAFMGSGDYSVKTGINLASEGGYDSCGACVLIYGDYDPNAGSGVDPVGQYYLATAGTLNLTNVGGGTGSGQMFAGSLSNVTFAHVTIDPMTQVSTVVPGCTSAITSASFSAPITVNFTGKDPTHILGHRHR